MQNFHFSPLRNMLGSHCTRCKGGIYTAWRTLDQKKFYHPHCFTCALCGVILECVEECGVPNLKDVYCRQCYKNNFSFERGSSDLRNANSSLPLHLLKESARNPSPIPYEKVRSPPPSPLQSFPPYSRRTGVQDSTFLRNPTDFDVLFNSTKYGQYFEENIYGIRLPTQESSISSLTQSGDLVRTRRNENKHESMVVPSPKTIALQMGLSSTHPATATSRIPRPTSANSAKSLAKNSEKSKPDNPPTTKQSPRAGNSCRNVSHNPSNSASKMQRSISFVQPRKSLTQGTQLPSTNKSTRSLSSRPSSAKPKSNTSPAPLKRQCAASFSLENESCFGLGCSESGSTHGDRDKPSPPRFQYNNATQTHDSHDRSEKVLPSSKSILSAIRKEDSNATCKTKISSHKAVQRTTKKASRSFKLTFDCPICISSLVPGSNLECEGGQSTRSRNTGNVVTSCGHLFHRDCMENWLKLKGNKRCPICSALCLPETLQSVYLECNVSADLNTTKKKRVTTIQEKAGVPSPNLELAFDSLRSEYETLQAKYNAVIVERNDNLSCTPHTNSDLQRAYDIECQNRLHLQWENKELLAKLEHLQKY